jgi:hypothetical protein
MQWCLGLRDTVQQQEISKNAIQVIVHSCFKLKRERRSGSSDGCVRNQSIVVKQRHSAMAAAPPLRCPLSAAPMPAAHSASAWLCGRAPSNSLTRLHATATQHNTLTLVFAQSFRISPVYHPVIRQPGQLPCKQTAHAPACPSVSCHPALPGASPGRSLTVGAACWPHGWRAQQARQSNGSRRCRSGGREQASPRPIRPCNKCANKQCEKVLMWHKLQYGWLQHHNHSTAAVVDKRQVRTASAVARSTPVVTRETARNTANHAAESAQPG